MKHCVIFCNQGQRGGGNKKGAKGYGKQFV